MAEFIVNIYQLGIAPVNHYSQAINFKSGAYNAIKMVSDHLLNLKNKVSDVCILKDANWKPTRQSLYLHEAKKGDEDGVFYGIVEVGSHGSFDRLRRKNGQEPYQLKTDDLSMREFFYRIEMPPDSAVGFLVIERHGRYTPFPAIQQSLRQLFHRSDYSIHFHLVTDEDAFDEYLTGRVSAIKARYIPRMKESRKVLKESLALGAALQRDGREDLDIKFKVRRPLTKALKKEIRDWLTSDPDRRPEIVKLPIPDDPDRIILCIETDDGRQKQLHPGMIADMALSLDLTARVTSLESRNTETAKECAKYRATLVASQ